MNILILGNGFDLAHDLPTSYKDFLGYCETQLEKPKNKSLEPFHTNIWIKHFLNVYQKLPDTWIDLEKEIYNVIENISMPPTMSSSNYPTVFSMIYGKEGFSLINIFHNFNKMSGFVAGERGYARIEPDNEFQLNVYIVNSIGLVNFLYDQLREFTMKFEEYLLKEVLKNLKSVTKFQLALKSSGEDESNDVYVLSFNYTDTCERLYDKRFNADSNMNIKTFYVHGEVDECNLVLGTQNFDDLAFHNDRVSEDLKDAFFQFRKFNQRYTYERMEQYQNLLTMVRTSKSIPVFHIIGHSLDDIDHDVLKLILCANPESKIKVYYHNKETNNRLVNRIVAITGGKAETMSRVDSKPLQKILIKTE